MPTFERQGYVMQVGIVFLLVGIVMIVIGVRDKEKRAVAGIGVSFLLLGIVFGGTLILSKLKVSENIEVPTPALAEYQGYSNHGLYFEYPEGMTISEAGVVTQAADEASGLVQGTTIGKEIGAIAISWQTTDSEPELELALDTIFSGIQEGLPDVAIYRLFYIDGVTASGYPVKAQTYTFEQPIEGDMLQMSGAAGVWYCKRAKRLYSLQFLQGDPNLNSTLDNAKWLAERITVSEYRIDEFRRYLMSIEC